MPRSARARTSRSSASCESRSVSSAAERTAASSSSTGGAPHRELELGPEQRERRPQLVARIRDESPLARERGLEPAEHLVQRLAEPRDLVVRGRHRQPLTRLDAEISSASRRIDSTGRRAAPARTYAAEGESMSTIGPPMNSSVVRLSSASPRSSRDAPTTTTQLVAVRVDRARQEPAGLARSRARRRSRRSSPAGAPASCSREQQRGVGRPAACCPDRRRPRLEHLREVLFRPPTAGWRCRGSRRALGAGPVRPCCRRSAQALLDRSVERGAQAEVEESPLAASTRPWRGESERQAHPDREPAHGAPSSACVQPVAGTTHGLEGASPRTAGRSSRAGSGCTRRRRWSDSRTRSPRRARGGRGARAPGPAGA